jgi:hypothetical protein
MDPSRSLRAPVRDHCVILKSVLMGGPDGTAIDATTGRPETSIVADGGAGAAREKNDGVRGKSVAGLPRENCEASSSAG